MSTLIATLVLVASAQVAPAPPLATRRDAPPPRTGTAVIRGRITERDTDVPVVRLPVKLFRVGWTLPYETLADDEGRFEFTRLAAGQYSVSAEPPRNRATHLQTWFVEKSSDSSGAAKPIELMDGEVRQGVDMALVPLVAINGRVLDEDGEPLSDIRVQAEPVSRALGVSTSRSRETDDRGTFRVFGLVPGRYRICADPGTDFADVRFEALSRTCYPSTAIEEESPAVALAAGENSEIEIRMRRARVFTLSGTILDVSGAPAARASISVSKILKGSPSGGRGWQVDDAGRFTVTGLAPGEYWIEAQIGGPHREDDSREPQAGYVNLTLASDVENLVVTMVRPARVAGRVTFEDGPPQRRLSLRVIAFDASPTPWRPSPQRAGTVREDLTFELSGLYGHQILMVEGLGREWVVKSIRYRSENITGLPAEYKSSADPDDLQIVLTSRVGRVIARVVDESGKPATDVRVMLFPADPRQWVAAQGTVQHSIRQKDGSYAVGPVRAGEYFIVAPAPEEFIYTSDRSRLEALAKVAERITLGENEERQIELRVVRIP